MGFKFDDLTACTNCGVVMHRQTVRERGGKCPGCHHRFTHL